MSHGGEASHWRSSIPQAPCDKGCVEYERCAAEEVACITWVTWVRTGGSRVRPPIAPEPTRENFLRVYRNEDEELPLKPAPGTPSVTFKVPLERWLRVKEYKVRDGAPLALVAGGLVARGWDAWDEQSERLDVPKDRAVRGPRNLHALVPRVVKDAVQEVSRRKGVSPACIFRACLALGLAREAA